MRSFRSVLPCVAFALSWIAPGSSFGQVTAAADTLFEKAVKQMQAGEFSAACPLLDEALRLDARDGTLFTLANCRDREGKIATALGHYRKYLRAFGAMTGASRKKHADRAVLAEGRVKELVAEVPSMKLVWPGGMPPNTKILVDGAEFPAAIDIVWELEPGEHRVAVSRDGVLPYSRVVTLERKKPVVEVDLTPQPGEFAPLPPEKPDATTTSPQGRVESTPVVTEKPQPITNAPIASSNVQRTTGFVALGVGAAGLALGGVMGGLALAQKSTVDKECTSNGAAYDCTEAGRSAVDEIVKYGMPSTVGFIAGGVLVAAGLVLVVTAPKTTADTRTNWQIKANGRPGFAFVSMEGSF